MASKAGGPQFNKLKIFRGESIGIIGATGSGKSTLINLLMGLIPPSSGQVSVDSIDIHDVKYPGRLPSWRSMIAHVPQSIFWWTVQLLRISHLVYLKRKLIWVE